MKLGTQTEILATITKITERLRKIELDEDDLVELRKVAKFLAKIEEES